MTDHAELIARLQTAMDAYDSDTLGDDPHEFDSWKLLYDAKAALEAQSAPPSQSVQDALDLLDSIHGDAAIQYHAYASLHDAINAIEQSAPLVADSREALARALNPDAWVSSTPLQMHRRDELLAVVDHIFASGVVSVAADRDRAVWMEGWLKATEVVTMDGERFWLHTVTPEGMEPNPYCESEARNG